MEYKTLQYTVCITHVHLMVVHTMVCVCVCLRLYLYCVRHGDTQPVFGRSPTTSSQSSSFVRLWRLIKKNCVCAVEYNMIFGWLDENYFLLFFCLRLHNYTRKPTQTTFYLISILFFSFFPFYFSRRKKNVRTKLEYFYFYSWLEIFSPQCFLTVRSVYRGERTFSFIVEKRLNDFCCMLIFL